ncbi:hypothetical protein PBCV1_a214aL [Paramecium bursaria Chlorella virus 1]|uniref:Uncharacterized protein n=1 Tax=Paramecium bursaria Chlorella virus 1 TaxID=10506 RepID=F8TTZ8_PBCV1|nr:hypothetical protein PBCV1_a214aL [Paramecium bursaria Chlorella virus 1]AEI70059.1 hypothetical protein [Paramecium bursaria Chlorella virus 1]
MYSRICLPRIVFSFLESFRAWFALRMFWWSSTKRSMFFTNSIVYCNS